MVLYLRPDGAPLQSLTDQKRGKSKRITPHTEIVSPHLNKFSLFFLDLQVGLWGHYTAGWEANAHLRCKEDPWWIKHFFL